MDAQKPLVSVIVPFHDEERNVEPLSRELFEALKAVGRPFEVFFVDDASSDGTLGALKAEQSAARPLTVLALAARGGQTGAIQAALDRCHGGVVVTLDGDLQNDPADIARALARLEEGFDMVVGWRRIRRDPLLRRALPSRAANAILRAWTGVPVRDVGCGLRAFRREVLARIRLYGQMHRFLPILAHWRGARVTEVEVAHRPRRWGKAHYGLSRALRLVFDLVAARFLAGYFSRPMMLFGAWGALSLALSVAVAVAVAWMKLSAGVDMTGNPLFYLCILLAVVGSQLFALGLLGEVNIRIYHETLAEPPYPRVETYTEKEVEEGRRQEAGERKNGESPPAGEVR